MSMMICVAGRAPREHGELFAPSQETVKQQGKAAHKQPLALGKTTSWSIQCCNAPSGRLLLKMYLASTVFVLPAEEHQILFPLEVMGKNSSTRNRPCQFCVKQREQ